jgi:hypothetical protein
MKFREFILNEGKHPSEGKLEYGPGIRAVIWVDKSLANYRKLIPKSLASKPQRYPPHITVVRTGKEQPITNEEAWGKYEGEVIHFTYDSNIQFDGTYYYLNVFSDRIGDIREELGLPRYRDGQDKYHIALGNVKSEPIL